MAVKKTTSKQSAKSTVWTTKRVDSWMKDYANGVIHKDNPWLDGQIGIRNPNIVFEYTPEEIEELTKCAGDILYFANNYCYCLHGNKGYQPITLRDYQEEMLEGYSTNRFSITCSSRQIGKCSFNSFINIIDNNKTCDTTIDELYLQNKKKTVLSKIKLYLYKLYKKL